MKIIIVGKKEDKIYLTDVTNLEVTLEDLYSLYEELENKFDDLEIKITNHNIDIVNVNVMKTIEEFKKIN